MNNPDLENIDERSERESSRKAKSSKKLYDLQQTSEDDTIVELPTEEGIEELKKKARTSLEIKLKQPLNSKEFIQPSSAPDSSSSHISDENAKISLEQVFQKLNLMDTENVDPNQQENEPRPLASKEKKADPLKVEFQIQPPD